MALDNSAIRQLRGSAGTECKLRVAAQSPCLTGSFSSNAFNCTVLNPGIQSIKAANKPTACPILPASQLYSLIAGPLMPASLLTQLLKRAFK